MLQAESTHVPRDDYDYVINESDIQRVDIVQTGGCSTCKLPTPHKEALVEASKTIKLKGFDIMAEPKKDNKESVKNEGANKNSNKVLSALKKIDERIKKLEERMKKLENKKNGKSTKDGKSEDDLKDVVEASNKTVMERLDKIEQRFVERDIERTNKEINEYMNTCIEAGKIAPAQRELMTAAAKQDFDAFQKMMDEQPVLIDASGERISFNVGDDEKDSDKDDEFMNDLKSFHEMNKGD